MYSDILASGSRRFAVVAMDPSGERLAEVGVVFYLTDLQDVAEQTGDEVKYICDHRVIGRVRIRRVLNPSVWYTATTYLRAETTPVEDDEDDPGGTEEEQLAELERQEQQQVECLKQIREVLEIHSDMQNRGSHSLLPDEVFFRKPKIGGHEVDGTWKLATAWSEYHELQVMEKQQHLNEDVNFAFMNRGTNVVREYDMTDEDLAYFGAEDDDDDDVDVDIPDDFDIFEGFEDDEDDDEEEDDDAIDITQLPAPLRKDVQRLQEQHDEDMESLVGAQSEFVHALLRSKTSGERIGLLEEAVALERRRLFAKKAMFGALRDVARGEVS